MILSKKNILLSVFFLYMNVPSFSETDHITDVNVSIDSIKHHLSVLANDSLFGRGTGMPGGLKAAHYIASKLTAYNLKPAGLGNSYYQQIPFIGVTPQKESDIKIVLGNDTNKLCLNRDFLVNSAGIETYLPLPVPLVFVGYGIIAPEYDYNDYQLVDVANKIVIFLSGEPFSNDNNFFKGRSSMLYNSFEIKQRLALSRGALGCIMIPNPKELLNKGWDYYVQQYSFEEVSLVYMRSRFLSLFLNPNESDKFFRNCGYDFDSVLDMDEKGNMKSFPLQTTLIFDCKFTERNFIAPNVIALKEGTDPQLKDTYLILSAHYDHLGIGNKVKGDSIYNGFIDNASGTSALLEIARCLSKSDTRRSIIFLFTTAEEEGLLGSLYYTDHPVFPLYKTIANINIDGLAFIDNFTSIIAVGAEFSSLENITDTFLDDGNIKRSTLPKIFNTDESNINSDQFSFAKAGIPSVIIVEGIDYVNYTRTESENKLIEWIKNYYHSPFDDKNQPINYGAMLEHAQIIFSFCKFLADSNSEPEWKKSTPFINARLRSIAEKR
jgi:hypothetical protein